MKTIIFEPGRTLCKGGYGEDQMPLVEIPSVCCIRDFEKENRKQVWIKSKNFIPDHSDSNKLDMSSMTKTELKKRLLIGKEAINEVETANGDLIYPLHRNLVMSDWKLCEIIWERVLLDLGLRVVAQEEEKRTGKHGRIMVILPSSGGLLIKEKVNNWLARDYSFEEIIFVPGYLLTLYSYGIETGVVVDIGTFWTNITPVVEGVSDENYSSSIPIGGRSLEDYLKVLLSKRGVKFSGRKNSKNIQESRDDLLVRRILRENCFVSTNEKSTREAISTTTCYLESIKVDSGSESKSIFFEEERFQVTENVFFKPFSVGIESLSICEAILKVINKCPLDSRKLLMENIYLTGGSSLFLGLPQRIEANLTQLFLESKLMGDIVRLNKYKISVIDDPMRDFSTFKGANIYLQLI
ncbi:Actin family protein [Cryptosporidium felis]|nr:Actin family protein [Cryptosporidium felis]